MPNPQDRELRLTACPHCGDPLQVLDRTIRIEEQDILGILTIWSKRTEEVTCSNCGTDLKGHPPLAVSLPSVGQVFQVAGRNDNGNLKSGDRFYEETGVQDFTDLPSFRIALYAALVKSAEPVHTLCGKIRSATFLPPLWLSLTAPAFAAAAVISALKSDGDVPCGTTLGSTPSLDSLPGTGDLGELQGWVLVRLAEEACSMVRSGTCLMDELNSFIRPGSILPQALLTLEGELSRLKTRADTDPLVNYCKLAVSAAAFDAAARHNPFENRWASSWLWFETDDLGRNNPDQALKSRARLHDDLVGRTIPSHAVKRLIPEAMTMMALRIDGLSRSDLSRWESEGDHPLRCLDSALTRIGQDGLIVPAIRDFTAALPANLRSSLMKGAGSLMKRAGSRIGSNSPSLCAQAVVATTVAECKSILRKAKAIKYPASRAAALASVGQAFNRLQTPQAFLRAIGEQPWPYERNLPGEIRFNLWLERSNALRYLGRTDEALTLARELEPLAASLSDPETRRKLMLNIAILIRDTGSPDEAARSLKGLLRECPDTERLAVLESLAIAYQIVGRHVDAADALAVANGLGIADVQDQPYLLAAEALARANANQLDQAQERLAHLPTIDPGNRRAILMEMAAWSVAITKRRDLVREFFPRLRALLGAATGLAQDVEKAAAGPLAQGTYEAIAFFCDACDQRAKASHAAQLAQQQAESRGGAPHPAIPLLVAIDAFSDGRGQDARDALEKLPAILRRRYGRVSDQDAALGGFRDLRRWFERAARAAFENDAAPSDLRAIMELRRETFRHARPGPSRTAPKMGLYAALDDSALWQLSQGKGRVLVLEWLDLGGVGVRPRITVIGGSASPDVSDLPSLPIRPASVAPDLLNRLENWVGAGDPFDFEAWRILEEWARNVLGPEVRVDDHVVVIEDHSSAHVPWHVAMGPIVPVSYVASWSALLRSTAAVDRTGDDGLGVLMVPRQNETRSIREAFDIAYEALAEMAPHVGVRFLSAKGSTANGHAALEVIGGSRFSVLLCHGIYENVNNEVALLVADQDTLPPKIPTQSHRLSRRHIAEHPHAAQIIVSAACSSGAGFFAGLGERLGLFREFHQGGTRTLIAPRWRSHAPITGGLVVDITQRHLVDGTPLGIAVRGAALAAIERGVPPRHAWNLTLEGDWR